MRINDAGLNIIKKFEGLVDGDPSSPGYSPYRCPAGIPTIAWGAVRYRVKFKFFVPHVTVNSSTEIRTSLTGG